MTRDRQVPNNHFIVELPSPEWHIVNDLRNVLQAECPDAYGGTVTFEELALDGLAKLMVPIFEGGKTSRLQDNQLLAERPFPDATANTTDLVFAELLTIPDAVAQNAIVLSARLTGSTVSAILRASLAKEVDFYHGQPEFEKGYLQLLAGRRVTAEAFRQRLLR